VLFKRWQDPVRQHPVPGHDGCNNRTLAGLISRNDLAKSGKLDADYIKGTIDRTLLAKLMENSMAPADSIYALGRRVPEHSIIENITAAAR